MTWNRSKVRWAFGKWSPRPLMKAGDMSTLASMIRAGSPPWTTKSSLKAFRGSWSLPSTPNRSFFASMSTTRVMYFCPRLAPVSSIPIQDTSDMSTLLRASSTWKWTSRQIRVSCSPTSVATAFTGMTWASVISRA